MCGIAGYIGKKSIEPTVIRKTLELMENRGPDHQGYKHLNPNGVNIFLLHSRLSIIDCDVRANQPFVLGGCSLVFNGEIYNYIELRGDLKKQGVECVTTSDTEVLLRYYLLYGEDCVKYFEGMWAFAIYDTQNNKLFLSRDRFAEKPLYYYQTNDGFYYGSEIKFIRSLSGQPFTINQRHLLRYLVQGYKSLYKTEETFFNEINEIDYATNLVINHDLKIRTYRYWVPQCRSNDKISISDAIDGARHYLLESVRIRLRSDVPLAFCLSGGVDSAALVSIAAKQFNYNVSSFSIIDRDERYNEYDNIKATIEDTNCKSTLVELSYDKALPRLQELIKYHDVPVATITYFVHSMLSEQISAKGYKVAFSGTSADELFTGYYDHFLLHLNAVRDSDKHTRHLNDWEDNILPFVRNPTFRNPDLYKERPGYREHVYDNSSEFMSFLKVPFGEEFKEELLSEGLLRNRMMNELFYEITPVVLHEDDLNSMFYSIENRSPYLDSKLFEFAHSIPDEYLVQDGYGKYILREAMKGILNDKVRLDRQKKGFNASINTLFDFSDKETREYLLEPEAQIFELIDRKEIARLLDLNPAPNHYSKYLFNFMNAKIFLEQN
ncbi:MAG: asparagine synthase (glutamine-hydrolyzing) [Candidatus Scalindua sp.]|jgi:asparagine synthase (glutamine-hydrolysing)|nr:asparagine synthase (glutamine-hydrolyzing) [Candidatus Scalindua sp.]